MIRYTGWLLDLYPHPQKGVVLWLAGDDGAPASFHLEFEVTFYAGGPHARLRELGGFLRSKFVAHAVRFTRETKDDLFAGPQELLGVHVADPVTYKRVVRQALDKFPDLSYSDVEIPISLRFAARYDVFLMAHCEAFAEADGRLARIAASDSPWELDPVLPRLRRLRLRPDADPSHAAPKQLIVRYDGAYLRAPLDRPRELLCLLNSILETYDPDVIESHHGDAWLFPHLFELAKQTGVPFNPNRDPSVPVVRRKEVNFYNYGKAHYRGPQVHLRGRWHVDLENCMTYGQYGLLGAIEQVRYSSLPLQEVARRSPGASIAAMQDLTALRRGVLVPYQRQKGEISKNYNQLIRGDRGGLIFQPPVGLFANVAVLDFSSLMASLMIEYNVSPETVVALDAPGEGLEMPELGVKVLSQRGLVPETLQPMRDKRLVLKKLLKTLDQHDPRYRLARRRYKAASDAAKWLTVVCYGRLGFANSTFGRINAHEVVSLLSRQVITKAREVAEAKGFNVLHVYVDSLFISGPNASPQDFQGLADEIERATQLPMELENVYSWFAFLGSRASPSLSVANRFFGIAPNGEHKIRGIALRRGDTPAFVAHTQLGVLDVLAKEPDPAKLPDRLMEVLEYVRKRLALLKSREVPLEQLVVSQTLSRELKDYSVMSPAATVAKQLQARGKDLKMGQRMHMIYISPAPGVHAWDSDAALDPRRVDAPRYRELLLRAVHEILGPLGLTERALRDWLFSRAAYLAPPGMLYAPKHPAARDLPILAELKRLRVEIM